MDNHVHKDGQRRERVSKTKIRQDVDAGHSVISLLLFILLILPIIADAQQTSQEWQATATKDFPQLAVKDSQFNRVYVAAFAALKAKSPTIINTREIFYLLAVGTSQALSAPSNVSLNDPRRVGDIVATQIPALQAAVAKIDQGSFITTAEIKQVDAEGVGGV